MKLSQNTRDITLSYGENPKSLSQLVLKRYRIMNLWQNYRS